MTFKMKAFQGRRQSGDGKLSYEEMVESVKAGSGGGCDPDVDAEMAAATGGPRRPALGVGHGGVRG